MMEKTKFKYINCSTGEMADTPAACDRESATIYINPILYNRLTPFERKFWIWHEKGHILLNTNDEFEADAFAFRKMAGTEWRSLKQMIEALEHLLDSNKPYHQERIDHMYRLALQWDREHPLNKSTASKVADTLSDTMIKMGQLIILSSSTTAGSMQKKDNTLMVVGLAFAAIFVFSTFLKN